LLAGVGVSLQEWEFRYSLLCVNCSRMVSLSLTSHPRKWKKTKTTLFPTLRFSLTFSVGHVAGEDLPVPPPANDQGQSFLQLKPTFTFLGDITHCKNRLAVFLSQPGCHPGAAGDAKPITFLTVCMHNSSKHLN
jgi:hypothetical protein